MSRLVARVRSSAIARVACVHGPLKANIEAHEETGDDLTKSAFHEYVALQYDLLPYRWERTKDEVSHLFSGEIAVATITFSDFIVFLSMLTRMAFIFVVCVMLGRGTIMPPVAPTSPFAPQNENQDVSPTIAKSLHLPAPPQQMTEEEEAEIRQLKKKN